MLARPPLRSSNILWPGLAPTHQQRTLPAFSRVAFEQHSIAYSAHRISQSKSPRPFHLSSDCRNCRLRAWLLSSLGRYPIPYACCFYLPVYLPIISLPLSSSSSTWMHEQYTCMLTSSFMIGPFLSHAHAQHSTCTPLDLPRLTLILRNLLFHTHWKSSIPGNTSTLLTASPIVLYENDPVRCWTQTRAAFSPPPHLFHLPSCSAPFSSSSSGNPTRPTGLLW
jgi:hypothetical protein